MPKVTIEAPEGASPAAKRKMLQEITEAVDRAYHIPDIRGWLREYPASNVSQDGRVGAEPVRPVCLLDAPELTSLDAKHKLVQEIDAAVARAYRDIANTGQIVILIREYPEDNRGLNQVFSARSVRQLEEAMDNEALVLDLFAAIESRDLQRILQIYDPDVEFHWPPALPYGGSTTGYQTDSVKPTWQSIWPPLQPEPSDRRMDPRVIASRDDEVAVAYHQRGRDSKGRTFDGEVIGLYRVSAGRLKRAQMFYFDEQACARFLEDATMPDP